MSSIDGATATPVHFRRRHTVRAGWVYFRVLLRQSSWKLFILAAAVVIGTVLYSIEPPPPGNARRPFAVNLYGAWMALLGQPLDTPPRVWYLELLCAIDPVLG